jgi:hypothetical protein
VDHRSAPVRCPGGSDLFVVKKDDLDKPSETSLREAMLVALAITSVLMLLSALAWFSKPIHSEVKATPNRSMSASQRFASTEPIRFRKIAPAQEVPPNKYFGHQQRPVEESQHNVSTGQRFRETFGYPVALVDPPVEGGSLREDQVAEFDFLRQEFAELIQESGQDSTDPQYLQSWELGQELIDEEFRAFFGEEAYNQQQLRSIAAKASE